MLTFDKSIGIIGHTFRETFLANSSNTHVLEISFLGIFAFFSLHNNKVMCVSVGHFLLRIPIFEAKSAPNFWSLTVLL